MITSVVINQYVLPNYIIYTKMCIIFVVNIKI